MRHIQKYLLILFLLSLARISPVHAQLKPLPAPANPLHLQQRGVTDTIKSAINKGYPFYGVPLDYFVFQVDSPRGFFYGNGQFYLKQRKKWIVYSSESGEIFYNVKNKSIKEVLVYAGGGIKGTPETIYAKVYTLGKDSLPGTLLAKGQVSMTEIVKNGAKDLYTSIPISYGESYVGDNDIVVSLDYSQLTDDTFLIASTFMQDTTKNIGQFRIVQRIGQFLAGRWYNVDDAVFNKNPHGDQDLGIQLVVQTGPVLGTGARDKPDVFCRVSQDENFLFLDGLYDWNHAHYKILSLSGQLLGEGNLDKPVIPLGPHAAGAYVVQCVSQGRVFSQKMILNGN